MASCRDAETIQEGIDIARRYKVTAKSKMRALTTYHKYKAWIDQYRGGVPPVSIASGILHESGDNPLSTSDVRLKETGLWSLLPGFCQTHSIDPFDPEANIWGGARLRNERIKRAINDFPWIIDADPYDYTKLVIKFPGSVGYGGWRIIMRTVFPQAPTGQTRRHPFAYMKNWILTNPNRARRLKVGRMSVPLIVCRTFRCHATDLLRDIGQLAKPGEYRIIPRPAHLPAWNTSKFNRIWSSARSRRKSLFPEYLKTPIATIGTVTSIGFAGLLGVVFLGMGGWMIWKKYKKT